MVTFVDSAREPNGPPIGANFSAVIAPLTPAEISALWLNRRYRFAAGGDGLRFLELLDWDTLWRLITSGSIPPWKLRVTYGRRIVPAMFYLDHGELKADRLAQMLTQDSSVIVGRIEPHVQAIQDVCRDAETRGLPIAEVGVIVTKGGGGAFRRHYDMHDMVILQVEGSKRWRIFGPRVPEPVRELCCKNPPKTEPLFDQLLRPGDVLFLPAGFWHECDNERGRSLHLGLFMNPPPPADNTH